MSKAFISKVIQTSTGLTTSVANHVAGEVIAAIVAEIKKEGTFGVPGFGTFTVKETKARKRLDPRNSAPIHVEAGKTVRFRASPVLKNSV